MIFQKILKLNSKVIPLLIGSIFLYSGIDKLINFEMFIIHFSKISLVYYLGLWPLGYVLGILEIITALFLFLSILKRQTLILALILFVIFTAYLINVFLGLGNYATCSCGGIFNFLTISQHIVFNIILIFLIFLGLNNPDELNV